MKKRALRTLGLFAPGVCCGRDLVDEISDIYEALKEYGFKETRWQFVYHGQIGGLVLPYNDGRNEVHVRFYSDRIFAEFEVGRASLAHFIGPFLNANPFILDLLREKVSDTAYSIVTGMMEEHRLCSQERELDIWNHVGKDHPIAHGGRKSEDMYAMKFDSAIRVFDYLSWQKLNLIAASVFATLSSVAFGIPIGVFCSSLFIVLSLFLPRIGEP